MFKGVRLLYSYALILALNNSNSLLRKRETKKIQSALYGENINVCSSNFLQCHFFYLHENHILQGFFLLPKSGFFFIDKCFPVG